MESFKAVGVLINIIQDYLQGHADRAFHLIRSCINTIGSYMGRIIMPNTFENSATNYDKAINKFVVFFI